MLMIMLRLRRAGTVLGIGLTSILTGACAAFAYQAVVPGWLYRFLAAVVAFVLFRITWFLVGRSQLIRRMIKTQEELRLNPDFGDRPRLVTPIREDEKANCSFLEQLFPAND